MADVIITIPGATNVTVDNAPATAVVVIFPASNSVVTTVIDLAEGVDRQTIIDYLNCVALCKLEEDNKEIIGWEWK